MTMYRVLRSFVGRRENGLAFRYYRGQEVEIEDVRDWLRAGFLEEIRETEEAVLPIKKAERAVGKRVRAK